MCIRDSSGVTYVDGVKFGDASYAKTFEKLGTFIASMHYACLLYTSDAADERSSVDLGGRRIIKKQKRTGM